METLPFRFAQSLMLADACVNGYLQMLALNADDDPLRLNLPPMLNAVDGSLPSPEALRAMAALYLQAELEQTGIIAAAEMMAQSRSRLAMASQRAARKLEEFHRRNRDWYDQQNRDTVFARVFGLGRTANSNRGHEVNWDFQQRLASFCSTTMRYAEDYRWGQKPGPTREAALRQVATHLLLNLGPRQFSNTTIAAQLIQEQLRLAIDLLSDSDIGAIFQTRGLWATLRKLLGDWAPDFGRFVDRGQSGLRILNWLSTVMPELNAPPPYESLLPAGSPVFAWAATWLRATGLNA